MNKETLILGIEHELLLKEFIVFATKELGTIKMNDIIRKVNTSGKVSRFIIEARRINDKLGSEDFLACIHASSSFTFSKAETISIAAIALLMKWNHEIGKPNFISDDIYLNKRFFSILDKCDRYKTHINSATNFFERFNDHLVRIVTLNVINSYSQVIKTEITFDSVLCRAIKSGVKTEFRITDNLEGINLEPSGWKLKGYESDKGVKLLNIKLGEVVLIEFPFKLGSIVDVFDISDSNHYYIQIKVKSCYIQRTKDVKQCDALKEGYSTYTQKVNELLKNDPSVNAEYCLFEEFWKKIHGSGSFERNEWLWVFEFEDSMNSSRTATGLRLTQSQIDALESAIF